MRKLGWMDGYMVNGTVWIAMWWIFDDSGFPFFFLLIYFFIAFFRLKCLCVFFFFIAILSKFPFILFHCIGHIRRRRGGGIGGYRDTYHGCMYVCMYVCIGGTKPIVLVFTFFIMLSETYPYSKVLYCTVLSHPSQKRPLGSAWLYRLDYAYAAASTCLPSIIHAPPKGERAAPCTHPTWHKVDIGFYTRLN